MSAPPKISLDIERLRFALAYDPATGLFAWRIGGPGKRRHIPPAGYRGNRGYIKICLDGEYWLAHRLAWAFVHGELPLPPLQLDHINRIRHDNRIVNLRVVSHIGNVLNSDRFDRLDRFDEDSRGTTFVTRRNKWQAQIHLGGTNKYLGCFDTQAEAHEAYRAVAAAVGRLVGAVS